GGALRHGRAHIRPGGSRVAARGGGVPRRYRGGRPGTSGDGWRSGPGRHRPGPLAGRGPGPGLPGRGPDLVAGDPVPQGHRRGGQRPGGGVKVAVLMGSKSDAERMKAARETLSRFGVEVDERVLSAHRNPDEVAAFARGARDNGYAALICGAGWAAHLAGVVAAHTTLPVVGVPLSGSALNGLDALYSTVQMPPGIPVATVAIDGAANAAWQSTSPRRWSRTTGP